MRADSLALVPADDPDRWARFLERSPQGTRFCDPRVLSLFDEAADAWFLERNGVPVVALVQAQRSVRAAQFLPYCYYQGPMFSDEIWSAAPPKRTEYEIALAERCMEELSARQPAIALSLHPSLSDVRGYDWFHYHEPAAGRAQISPRYTAVVELTGVDAKALRAAARSARRQEERYARGREGLEVVRDGKPEELIALMRASFERQGLELPVEQEKLVRRLAEGLPALGFGHLISVRDPRGEARANALVMQDLHGVDNVMLVGTSDDRYAGTLLYFGLLDQALARGRFRVDFNGANSPRRGYFKHSIGARATLHFEVRWRRPAPDAGAC